MNAQRLASQTKAVGEECLFCSTCKSRFGLNPLLYCPSCKYALEYRAISTKGATQLRACLLDNQRTSSRSGHFRFIDFLPVPPLDDITSLGEGNTPLLHCERMQERYSLRRLYCKDEGRNPTGSWKDRAVSVVVNCAKAFGYRTVSVYSCGNAGGSTAAYAARAGMRSVVFVLPTIDREMSGRMTAYGGRVVPIQTSRKDLWTTSKLGDLLEDAQRQRGWFPVTSVRSPYVGSPFYTEGFKTIAFEIFQELGEHVPDWVFVPAGTGEGLSGVWKGFRDIQSIGCSHKLPKMVGVQSENAAPLVHAYQRLIRSGSSMIRTVGGPRTCCENHRQSRISLGAITWVTIRCLRWRGCGNAPVRCRLRLPVEIGRSQTGELAKQGEHSLCWIEMFCSRKSTVPRKEPKQSSSYLGESGESQ